MQFTFTMKILLPLVVWLTELITWIHCKGPLSYGGNRREIFFLHLEDGYFGCQVNQSTDVLQLYELSKLCDGNQDCYQGSDELARELKCTNNCVSESGLACQNGACLDSQCHCNDGFGGCSCEVPDENECKYRPCDIFAHCTNTLGSFHCSCFPGYVGDGFHCQDINECADPSIAARCVPNAECCNLPAHFLCKCKPGFEGDGEIECRDINECLNPGLCGANAECRNYPGNYTCDCKDGYRGNPFTGCFDVDECQTNLCAPGALCTNFPGAFHCACPPGTTGEPYQSGCLDVDECVTNPCGLSALCKNTLGGFECICPSGYIGDPYHQCVDVDECRSSPCGLNARCNNLNGTFSCSCADGYTGDSNKSCYDVDECATEPNLCGINAQCVNTAGSYVCVCPAGFTGTPEVFCENINECSSNPCGKHALCTDTQGGYQCMCKEDYTGDPHIGCEDIDECAVLDKPCGVNAKCENTDPGFTCLCPQGYSGKPDPKVACEQVDVSVLCRVNSDCAANAECIEGQCFCRTGFKADKSSCLDINECETDPCGSYSTCFNTPGSYHCGCQMGFIGAPPRMQCKAPCDDVKCGHHAYCKSDGQGAYCMCEDGWTFDPDDVSAGCVDIDECNSASATNRCGTNAMCVNTPGGFNCQCKSGFTGNAFKGCVAPCEDVKCGPHAYCKADGPEAYCICEDGWTFNPGDISAGCMDINECEVQTANGLGRCGFNSNCTNTPGGYKCQCKAGYTGDPYKECTSSCKSDLECATGEKCVRGQCGNPCAVDGACGLNAECRILNDNKFCNCPAGFTGDENTECVRMPYLCENLNDCGNTSVCQDGMCVPKCRNDGDCALNEKCLKNTCILNCQTTGNCFLGRICVNNSCIFGCTSDDDCGARETCKNNRCIDPCVVSPCGPNAVCTVANQRAVCSCRVGFVPNPVAKVACVRTPAHSCIENRGCNPGYACVEEACRPVCTTDVACLGNERCDTIVGVCKSICRRDDDCNDYEICDRSTCTTGCRNNTSCAGNKACIGNKCVDPCSAPNACGVNALCTVVAHQKQCRCLHPLQGDPFVHCRPPVIKCLSKKECPAGTTCYAGSCHATCRTDNDCLLDENCVGNVCKLSCSSDTDCNKGEICENRLCTSGCRTDSACSDNLSCVDGLCKNLCNMTGVCGTCAECKVTNHRVNCLCPSGYAGNPLVNCAKPVLRCDGSCPCDIESGFCITKCSNSGDCSCGEICKSGKCASKCNVNTACPLGHICKNSVCTIGCRQDKDCPNDRTCVNGKCRDTCTQTDKFSCGKNAICRVSDHAASCMCPDGYQGNPAVECVRDGCVTDGDCELTKKCSAEKVCTNPCLELSACGINARCTVANRNVQCSCPTGFSGNPQIECKQGKDSCLSNPCGENTKCQDIQGKYECSCLPGCVGDPLKGCLCEALRTDYCKNTICGSNALCRMHSSGDPQCYCPPEFPVGDPNVHCKTSNLPIDCRTNGCGKGATCEKGGGVYKCTCPAGSSGNAEIECVSETECVTDRDCPGDKTCTNGRCIDGCSLRGACGINALCQTINHKPQCSCPQCYGGPPQLECVRLADCEAGGPSGRVICSSNKNCAPNEACVERECVDPCARRTADGRAAFVCETLKKCVTRNHKPTCVCEYGYSLSANGELRCAPELTDCKTDEQCASVHVCSHGRCHDPCSTSERAHCETNRTCAVVNHKMVCLCLDDCNPSLSMCLRDAGCSPDTVCRNYECIDPCVNVTCPDGSFCIVEEHVPVCKFCPDGWRHNEIAGCVRSGEPLLGTICDQCPPGVPCNPQTGACGKAPGTAKKQQPCQRDTECLETEACYNGLCEDLCNITNVCASSAKCHAVKHRPVCTCPPGYQGDPSKNCYLPKTSFCFSDVDCYSDTVLNQVCLHGSCQLPCDAHNPCAANAICVNSANGAECSCLGGYQGNGFVGCIAVLSYNQPICQYNEDCPPDKLCDRLNRVCINPCFEDSCGENAQCVPKNHKIECQCLPAFHGNPYLTCLSVIGCVSDDSCAPNEACINGQCGNPCQCGLNAICEVVYHQATCKCLQGYTGNPLEGCLAPLNPCEPNPCGMHALCELDNGNPVCFCPKGMTGNPFKQCIPEGDDCRPNPCGPNSGCRVVQGSAVCFCLPEFEGDPPLVACRPPAHPCHPSPCGPNTQCSLTADNFAKCTCLPNYIESPNTIRGCVETRNPCDPNPCGFGAICDPNRSPCCFCPENTVGNPYKNCGEPVKTLCQPGPCGQNADCYITGSTEQCFCKSGYQGDPYSLCYAIPPNPCYPNPCAPPATCSVAGDGRPTCTCPPGVVIDASGGCTSLECTVDENCPFNKACVGYRCRDPCPGACGIGAVCRVEKHHPVCSCEHGLTGNPLVRCALIEAQPEHNPCMPYPCGPNTYCKISGKRAICTCVENFVGDPKRGCRPECTLNTDCAPDQACINYQCKNPCGVNNICGLGAVCLCRDHMPTCVCREGFAGNPFVHCLPKPDYPTYPNTTLPCTPNPCEPYSSCQVYEGQVAMCDPCSGPSAAYNPACHPECLCNADCPFNLACLSQKCLDPCPGSCGINTHCVVVHHTPICSCAESLTGNPYQHCSPVTTQPAAPADFCHRDRCGANAICRNNLGHVTCECPKGYFGNPYLACHPECVINTDCSHSKACSNNKCVDPCHGVCGLQAQCQVVNHQPVCYCPQDYTGDPFVNCYPNREYLPPMPVGKPGNPCDPSPCGPNSRCLISSQGFATCSCLPGYRGSPPVCKPECIVSTECPLTETCINQKCVNPCVGTCGVGAQCYVVNHNPICNCPHGHVGDPFVMCSLPPVAEVTPYPVPSNPCEPSPCGPNSICQSREGHPVCSCLANYFGSPPYCRPECVMNQECPSTKACINEKCRNPCQEACGLNSKCDVVNHTPYCTCLPGYEGDAFVSCSKKPTAVLPPVPRDPCYPSPCGENAQCTVHNGAVTCTCIPPYYGDPYNGACRPECVMNSDCPPNAACLSSHCRDPCPGVCGINAECTVVNHVPTCTCFPDHIGDPFQSCRPKPVIPPVPQNPCEPSPCGPNSICTTRYQNAVCSCKPGFISSPPNCRPECVVSAECAPNLACIAQKCADPCPGTCGLYARCTVINHNPICSCPPNTVGDPFVRCVQEEPKPPPTPFYPCNPSPCGANSECKEVGDRAVCSCLPAMLGAPPYCRPECLIHADCPTKLACLNNKCRDPCIGSCGLNANCAVINHQPVCSCNTGFQGDPFSSCNPIPATERSPDPRNPCSPNPCGTNAECINKNGVAACRCLDGFFGDPYSGCKRECESNSDCGLPLACIGYKCVDPCPGTCGVEAICTTVNHIPICSCPPEYTGDPFFSCRPVPLTPTPPSRDPCYPSPCGPNSQCREVNDQAVCTCLPAYVGSPPNCRPECVVSSECALDKACINQKCSDPCPNTCGLYALCNVRNHNPYCSCPPQYTGDPFQQCSPIPIQPTQPPTDAPPSCEPNPCGPHAQCRILNGNPVCSCLPDFIGSPPSCRPECVLSSECASQLACINQHCRDPCPGSCGINANCHVINHVPVCSCNKGHTGDPFSSCAPIPITTAVPVNPCHPSPCGPNAICHGDGVCECLPEYTGNPYESCRPECVISDECPRDKACIRNKCQNPCLGTCGVNANCDVVNHIPACTCQADYIGDPFTICKPKPLEQPPSTEPCIPNPCGPNSVCRTHNDQAVCSCLPEYQGSPPSCRPECVVSEECSSTQACVNKKCVNPCQGVCGLSARCEVINHSPICSCREGQTGDPFKSCFDIPPPPPKPQNPCALSPCGPNAHCHVAHEQASCSCLPGFVGSPPSCRPECVINGDCPRNLACINNKCRDPCPGSCGLNAQCQVVSNTVSCSCLPGHVGNPFEQCAPQQHVEPVNPCEPSPCGTNAICKQHNDAGSCTCIPGYQGNPYEGCRPECVLNSDCPSDKSCIRNKCVDPCPGICGTYATCTVISHVPNCNCISGYVGDPFTHCRPQPVAEVPVQMKNPCVPSPCGPNSKCVDRNGQAVCSCLPEYQGSPPDCRPECVVNSECPTNRACHKYKCTNPCPGTCGVNARCEVIHHRPICSCPPEYTGDPFQRCYQALPEPKPPTPPENPCVPSPCGPYSECHIAGSQPSCRCRESYVGLPPNCRPECVVNTDCPPTLACISEKCRDPCPGSCGFNAQCHVQNHIPTCTCQQEYTGDPFTQCTIIVHTEPPPKPDPCHPSPCGANAQCRDGSCSCLPNYFGDPYTGCRPECTMNTDCTPKKACVNQHCVDPCPGVCGQDAKCDVVNHIPTCSCPPQTTGDAFVACRPIVHVDVDPCNPSPCGPNSICRVSNGHAVCSCQPGVIGSPPSCRPECVVSAECALTQACLQSKCRDPCPGTCGLNAKCNVINHNPICSCPSGYHGDPFRHCQLAPPPPKEPPKPVNPCVPSPCGPNAVCQVHGDTPACSCISSYVGSPPNCRPECTINPECPSNLACINQRCANPCTGSCGLNAVCSVANHVAICTCIQGYNGDPFSSCQPAPEPPPTQPPHPVDPCYPSPCGPNARCRSENGLAACECEPEYQGNPYEGCRPECLISSDCIQSRACIRNKCQDPCPGTCGLSAICTVSNHIPICHCPEGTTGDAFRACEPIPIGKEPEHHEPCVPSPCGPNTKCRVNNNVAVCECIPGFEGSPSTSGCHPECVINADCPRNRACIKNKCLDPCPGVCGYKAVCQTINHSPVCSCPPPLIGDAFEECKEEPAPVDLCYPSPCGQNGHCRIVGGVASCTYPECIINQDCPRDKACFGQKCRDPCVGACGINALCQVVNHDAICSCPPGYYGEPKLQCKQETAPEPRPECIVNDDCSNDKACINHACKNPCRETANVCATNAECRVQQHRPYCFCRHGLTGNAQSFCYEIGCRADTDCVPTMGCVNRECTDPCAYMPCGTNAQCRVDGNHKARCHCPESHYGNPLVSCERPQCFGDSDCPLDLSCINQKCQSPCACAPNAMCNVVAHVPSCRCPPGYTGNPHESCIIAPITPKVECKMDADCASKLACFSGTCKNPCTETRPCGEYAECRVVDTLPLRTMTCHCLPGYVGDADVSCRRVPEKTPGCESNDDCSDRETCINRKCVEPCAVRNPCARNAVCHSSSHKAVCSCPDDLAGDPFTNCYKILAASPECTIDSDCPRTRACINDKCLDPCAISNPCDVYAKCNTIQHRPVCNCPDGWAGNPQIHCYKPECKADNDCLYDKACRNNNCVSPCAAISCGIDSECVVRAHVPQCVCPTGTQGNPLLLCTSVQCQYNEDCADHEACDRLNRKCRPVCERDTCAEHAECTARAHQPICTCLPGTHGDAYSECSESRTPPLGCIKDSDCPSFHACINQKCENPCRQTGICSTDQECQVQDTYPVRTVMCVCPPDTIATNDGRCKAIVPLECKADVECADNERCVRGSCIDACRIDSCGLNALCSAQHHRSVCSCPSYYTGNPHIECTNVAIVPMPPTIPECGKDDDCPFNLGCRNQKCINPCVLDSVCGRGSFCHVQNHKPTCRCPPGYEGSPLTECRPPSGMQTIGCVSNTECSPDESCINKWCVNPCNCGPHAECKVINHYPICYCQPGYSGNPQIGCVKVSCETEEQCSFDKVCYNGDCVNPCILGNPCAVSAQCYGDNHRAACKCPPSTYGDPFVKCEQVECQIDADCPQDRVCQQQRCVNPCADAANPPCAPNAICYVRNHATGCRCPDYLPVGNPLAYCERTPGPSQIEPECRIDSACPSRLACINEHCVNPCVELTPCSPTAKCNVLDSTPLRTLTCTCPEGWIANKDGECKPIVLPSPPGCESNADCPTNETCINRSCRNPCQCGLHTQCFVQNHRPICSCESGYEGNPNVACKPIGCRRDSECESGRACINGNCVNPCIIHNPCGPNADCYTHGNKPECRCVSGYRGNPYERCFVVGCRSNNDCPDDRSCINAQCINPCVFEEPCATNAQCRVKNHIALCRCPPGMTGNPYTLCQEERKVECTEDGDCPAALACFNNRCQNPCVALEPCTRPAMCEAIATLPVRTMICECPSGYISSGSGTCKAIPPITEVACTADSQCPSDRACVNGICKNPCNCGPNAECTVKNNKPICSCVPGYEGNPNLECVAAGCRSDSDCSSQNECRNRACVPACAADGSSCGAEAVCYGIQHRAVCECPPGLVGNPQIACTHVACKTDTDCPTDKSCVNRKCVNPCAQSKDCVEPAICVPYNHRADCSCPPGYEGNKTTACIPVKRGCQSDSECPSKLVCINERCVNPCEETPCGKNAECHVYDTTPVKTVVCECPPGYEGNAVVECTPIVKCAVEKGFVKEDGICVCPPNTALNADEECRRCAPELGFKVDESGHCVCDLERGWITNERGECICPPEHGYEVDYDGKCIPVIKPECESNDDCPDNKSCENQRCVNPCAVVECEYNEFCNAIGHRAICKPEPQTPPPPPPSDTPPARRDFPKPSEMIVSCLSDGVQVRMVLADAGFNGVLYVKGHSKEEECRKTISVPQNAPTRIEIFKVMFGSCGLIHVNGQASFVLVIQKHPKLVTYKAQAYHIKCVYSTSEQNVTIGFNVSMLTTAGTIANTGPPPMCMMKIVTKTGQEISSAEIGEDLALQVDVHPTSIYGGFARSCVAKTLDNNVENEYAVTDENGCATSPEIFGEWTHDPETQSLRAEFNAFKFPSSDNIRFQCSIRVCFGRCQPVNCRGYNAFGKRRKRDVTNSTDLDVLHEGQLREEITIESNAIFTIERHEERLVNPTEEPQTAEPDDICISLIGLIVSLIITALLALVAVAVSVSCWLMAYRRQPSPSGPLPHPSEFPNPIFAHHASERMSEPTPDYLS